jgi:hypothetical protein
MYLYVYKYDVQQFNSFSGNVRAKFASCALAAASAFEILSL